MWYLFDPNVLFQGGPQKLYAGIHGPEVGYLESGQSKCPGSLISPLVTAIVINTNMYSGY